MGTVAPLELAWTLAVGSGIYPCVRNLTRRMQERDAIKVSHVNGMALFVARSYVTVMLLLLLVEMGFALAGLLAMSLPASAKPITPIGLWTGYTVFGAGLLLTIVMFLMRYIDKHAIEYAASILQIGEETAQEFATFERRRRGAFDASEETERDRFEKGEE